MVLLSRLLFLQERTKVCVGAFPEINQGEALYIIRNLLRYIINGLPLYIIKPQENARWRVMRYSPKGADDMHHASRGDDIPSLRLG